METLTDAEVVIEAEKLAATFAADDGFVALWGLYCKSDNSRRQMFWRRARIAFLQLTYTDIDDALRGLEDADLEEICVLKLGRPIRPEDFCS